MKICVISTSIFPCPPAGYSGLEFLAWQIAKGLAAKGHQVALVAPEGSSTTDGYTLILIKGGVDEKTNYSSYWQALSSFDCIIDHSWQKWAYVLKMEGKLKAPVLGVLHAPVNTMYQQLPPLEKPCFVCISQDQADHFQALFSRLARVARNGIDLDFYKPLSIPRTDRFLFLARYSEIKGPDLAIEAAKKAGISLDLIGDTLITQEPELLKKCQAMADGKQICVLGNQTRGNCVWWYSQALCFLHPNQRFREPLGLAPLEAQACGLPVIAFDYGALRETVKHGETGWLVNSMNEFIERIKFGGFALRDSFREDCREWAGNFSIQGMISRYEDLCEEAVETGGW